MVWFGRGLKTYLIPPPAMDRDTFPGPGIYRGQKSAASGVVDIKMEAGDTWLELSQQQLFHLCQAQPNTDCSLPTGTGSNSLPPFPEANHPLPILPLHQGSPNKMPGGGKQSTPKKSSRKLSFKLLVQIPAGSVVDLKLDQETSRQLCELQEKIT